MVTYDTLINLVDCIITTTTRAPPAAATAAAVATVCDGSSRYLSYNFADRGIIEKKHRNSNALQRQNDRERESDILYEEAHAASEAV